MKTLIRVAALWLALLAALAVPAISSADDHRNRDVPVKFTFGIQWTDVDWSNPEDRITETLGAAGTPGGKVIAIATRDHLNAVAGSITSDYVALIFSDADRVYAEYQSIPAGYDPASNTASFGGPLRIVGGEGRFAGATGTLRIRSRILFSLPVGTFDIEGVIRMPRH
jgi:hypothetical protein